ncbi:MAG TPA: hypothetical protein VGT03_01270 [Candidatus Acidoferrales bacterium]|nr:hypothetical protein [Candidatus Acidoferrales bacterium]
MRKLHIISLLLLFEFLAPAASAHKRSWEAVEKLPPGTSISVKSDWLRTQCTFVSATDDQLVCQPVPPMQPLYGPWPRTPFPVPYPPAPPPDLAIYRREDIREVRLEHSVPVNVLTGLGIGAGVGAGLGASNDSGTLTRGGGALLGGLIGGLVGGVIARNAPLFHRGVVYKRGDALHSR